MKGIPKLSLRVLVTSSALLLLATCTVSRADSRARQQKMTVLILNVGSSVRSIFAGNQDSYLASFTDKAGNKQVIKLIDWFPGYIEEWSPDMTLGGTYRIVSFRAEWCDSAVNGMAFLKATPEILVDNGVAAVNSIPCYRIEHLRTKQFTR